MELSEFNNNYFTDLLDTLSSENKTVVLLGDFNADLLKYDQNSNISDFFDLMYSFSFRTSSAQIALHHYQQLS